MAATTRKKELEGTVVDLLSMKKSTGCTLNVVVADYELGGVFKVGFSQHLECKGCTGGGGGYLQRSW